MKFESTSFGEIVLDGKTYEHDIIITTAGGIVKRVKELGSHGISPQELELLLKGAPKVVIIGTGQSGVLSIDSGTRERIKKAGAELIAETTPQAIDSFNSENRKKSCLMHLTC